MYEEAQETVQYRNHLSKCPLLPVPPKSGIICSPAEVKFHWQVELKDHDAMEETKQCFEELCKQFPKVFSTSSEDIGRTNLITMDIDAGDSLPSAKKPYTLPLKHYEWVQQEIKAWSKQESSPEVFHHGLVLSLSSPRSQPQEKPPGGECASTSLLSTLYNPRW